MRKVNTLTRHVYSLHSFWVVMTTDMEVTWNLVDKDEAAKGAAFFCC